MSKKKVQNFLVTENLALNNSNSLIRLKSDSELPEIKPGQFINVEINNCNDIFLRRPFSIFEVNYAEKTISLIVKKLGKGSKKLSEIETGEYLNAVYPLGKHFSYPESIDKILLIGGGSGVAPMLFLARESGLDKSKVHVLLGAKSKEEHISVDDYIDCATIHYATDDGSFGEKGFVTNHPVFLNELKSFSKIYACGPDAMMKSVAREAYKAGIFCEVSLENLMACGFGVCLCCIEPTHKGNLCVCTEGPVFNINDLKWQN